MTAAAERRRPDRKELNMELMDAHCQWASRPADQRFQSLDALRRAVNSRRELSVDMPIKSTAVRIAPAPTGELEVAGTGAILTHWSFGQAAALAKAPAGFLRELPAPMAADVLNHRLQAADRESLRVLVGADAQVEGKAEVRAFLSDSYGRIWDAQVVEMVSRVVEGTSWTQPLGYEGGRWGAPLVPSGLYASDHDCFLFFIDEKNPVTWGNETLHRGFIVSNSEVGARKFKFLAFLYRRVCGNNIVWGCETLGEIDIRHVGAALSRARFLVQPVLQRYVESDTSRETEMIRQAQTKSLGKDDDEVVKTLRAKGWTKEDATGAVKLATEEEGSAGSVWNVVQGLTALARQKKFTDERLAMEQKAAQLLS